MSKIKALILVMLLGCQQPLSPTRNQVMVSIQNRSRQKVKQITLTHEKGTINKGGIDVNGKTIILFHSPTENAYHAIIIFDNGKTIKSHGAYVEGGYRVTETIYDDSVTTIYDY